VSIDYTGGITAEELERQRALDEAQRAQERLHDASPYTEPLFLPADAEGFATEAWTAAGPDESEYA